MGDLDSAFKIIEDCNNEKDKQIEELKEKNQGLEEELEVSRSETEDARSETEDVRSDSERKFNELKEENEDLRYELEDTRTILEQNNNELSSDKNKLEKRNERLNNYLEEISKLMEWGKDSCNDYSYDNDPKGLVEFIEKWKKPSLDISSEFSHNLRLNNDNLKNIDLTYSKISMLKIEAGEGEQERIEGYNSILKFLNIHQRNVDAKIAFRMILDYFRNPLNYHSDDDIHIIIKLKDGSGLYLTQI